MRIIEGVCTFAKIFADDIDDYALAQIKMLCDNETFMGSKVRVMPDVHPGVEVNGLDVSKTEMYQLAEQVGSVF